VGIINFSFKGVHMTKETLIIIGAGGHGKVVADIAFKMGSWKSIAFLDDNQDINKCLMFDVIGKVEDSIKYKDNADFFAAIGDNKTRENVLTELTLKSYSIATLIHPNATIGLEVEIGEGTVVMGGTVINSSTKIGFGVIINTSSSIDHDCVINDYVHVSPGVHIAGNVNIGKRTWLGIGSNVINNLNVCEDCFIGAGSLLIKSIVLPGKYVGSPVTKV
jgi:sugar O-acyltransferase (sialic acid O-acetyltransferase NeuD family)